MTTIAWDDGTHHAGEIQIDADGVTIFTDCCGCTSDTLTDFAKIQTLYHALGDWLVARNPLPDPTEETP